MEEEKGIKRTNAQQGTSRHAGMRVYCLNIPCFDILPGGAPPAQSPRSTVVPPITSGTPSLAPAPSPAQDTTTGSSPAPSIAALDASVAAPADASTSTISSLALLVSLVAASYSFL